MPTSIFLLAEGPADHRTVTQLADRVVLDRVRSDVDQDVPESIWLDGIRSWSGLPRETTFTAWRDIQDLAKQHQVRVLGGRAVRGLDRDKFRKAILVAEKLRGDRPRFMVVSRDLDTDNPTERRKSLEEIQAEYSAKGWVIVLAMALPFREAWVLNGFEPRDSRETKLLKEVHQELGFDPTHSPERLDAQSPDAKKNAKRVHEKLCGHLGSISDRGSACLESCSLGDLRKRGKGSGLADFLRDVEEVLIPRLVS